MLDASSGQLTKSGVLEACIHVPLDRRSWTLQSVTTARRWSRSTSQQMMGNSIPPYIRHKYCQLQQILPTPTALRCTTHFVMHSNHYILLCDRAKPKTSVAKTHGYKAANIHQSHMVRVLDNAQYSVKYSHNHKIVYQSITPSRSHLLPHSKEVWCLWGLLWSTSTADQLPLRWGR